MNRAIVLTDPECCADYVDQFLTALNSARPIMRRVGIRELPAELTSPVIYRYGSRKLKDKPFKDNPVIYVSPAGVRNLMKPAEDQAAQGEKNPGRDEHTRMLKEMRERVGTSFFFIDERNIPSAKDWFIAVSGSEKLIFYKMDSSYCFIMSEPEMVRAFYNFMEELPNSGNLLRNDLALEIIDSMIAGTGN